jgi:GNAT superfamily N-acetyltransferase
MEAQITFCKLSSLDHDSLLLKGAAELVLDEIGDDPNYDPHEVDVEITNLTSEHRTSLIAYDYNETVLAVGGTEVFGDDAVLIDIAVAPAKRGEGLGRNIVKLLETVAKSGGAKKLELHAAEGSAGFYEKLGYRRTAPALASLYKMLQD